MPSGARAGSDPYDGDALPPRVEAKHRPCRDICCLVFFLLAVAANIAIGAMSLTMVKDAPALAEDFNSCVSRSGSPQNQFDVNEVRRGDAQARADLQAAAASLSLDGISSHPGLLAGLGAAAVAVAAVWVFLLYRFTKCMVWTTLLFSVFLVAAVGAYFLAVVPNGLEVGLIYLALAALQLAFLLCLRQNINMAAGLISLAMRALRDFPSLILAAIAINVFVLLVYVAELVMALGAAANVEFGAVSGQSLLDGRRYVTSTVLNLPSGTSVQRGEDYCVSQLTTLAMATVVMSVVMLFWVTATLEAIRMAIASTVFGVFYYYAPDDPDKPGCPVCSATTWAFSVQLGTHVVSGMVLAIIDALRRMARQGSTSCIGAIIRCIVLMLLSCFEQLTRFLVVVTGLTGLSFWDSAKRTMMVMREAFFDGYITSAITVRILRLSGFVFAMVFSIVAWAGVDPDTFGQLWPAILVIMVGIYSPIFGIVLAVLASSYLDGMIADDQGRPISISGPLAGLFFGSVAHAILLFMEQLILDLVDSAFVCFAIDTFNGIISPRGEVVHRFMGANFGDQLACEVGAREQGVRK
ncbi:hypothetical protein FNF27_02485 [Cafeteria roenbergensis]|uniref:Choline transporter-like protein n=3 Tax=Cafeteria roenbergensis TaxID=33653 RepID=A0A5A8EE51_CAFRO|nr:hypothetical protein FNF31_00863 [Cafeteria roenbergensis]KAA0172339.1 hypothetical protein FNF28_00024 [Cafeteria roenbergensis]KAA0176096.1 hypothetical protein FNF27_02485 [Cafeteria roenbergensis]